MMTVGDTWQVNCVCEQVQTSTFGARNTDTQHRDTRMCAEASPNAFDQGNQCMGLNETYTLDSGTMVTLRCVRDAGRAPVLLSVDDCTVGGSISSSSAPLTSGGTWHPHHQALGRANPDSDHVGQLVHSANRLSVKYATWRSTRPVTRGTAHLSGGLCSAGQTCEVVLDGLDLTVDDLRIDRPWPAPDTNLRGARIRNYRRWIGVRRADGTLSFPNAKLMLSARIDGQSEATLIDAPQAIEGRSYVDQDGFEYFTIEGRFTAPRVRLDVYARFLRVGGRPTAVVTNRSPCGSIFCDKVHDASASTRYDGGSVYRYRWYDARWQVLSTGPSLTSRSSYAYPLQLRVEDQTGRWDVVSVPRPSFPPRFDFGL